MTDNEMTRAEMLTLAEGIATNLGDGWRAEAGESSWTPDLIGPDDQRVWVRQERGRLTIHAGLTHDLHSVWFRYDDAKLPSITVDPRKPAGTIAKDIARRILPSLQAIIAQARERKQAANDYEAKREAFWGELLSAGGDRNQVNGLDRLGIGSILKHDPIWGLSDQVNSDSVSKLELHCSRDGALALLKWITEYNDSKR